MGAAGRERASGRRSRGGGPARAREEGGYRAGRLSFLARFQPSNAYLDETAYCYIGEELVADPLASDDDEFFERRVIPFREAVAMAADDGITESVSKVAVPHGGDQARGPTLTSAPVSS